MINFSSDREKRLWLGALAVLVTIYATLGFAGEVAGFLQEQGLLEIGFITGLGLAALATFSQWLMRRPSAREVWAMLGLAAVVLMVWVRIENPAERSHLFEYGLLAVFVYQALRERQRNGRLSRSPVLLAILTVAALGWIDEGIQYFLPGRVYDFDDILFNTLAAFVGSVGSWVMGWERKK